MSFCSTQDTKQLNVWRPYFSCLVVAIAWYILPLLAGLWIIIRTSIQLMTWQRCGLGLVVFGSSHWGRIFLGRVGMLCMSLLWVFLPPSKHAHWVDSPVRPVDQKHWLRSVTGPRACSLPPLGLGTTRSWLGPRSVLCPHSQGCGHTLTVNLKQEMNAVIKFNHSSTLACYLSSSSNHHHHQIIIIIIIIIIKFIIKIIIIIIVYNPSNKYNSWWRIFKGLKE